MLDVNGTVLILLISFLAFIWALDLVFVKPVSKTLELRAAKVEKDLEAAKVSRKDAEAVLEDYKKRLSTVRGEAQTIINDAVTAAQKTRNDEIAGVQAQGRKRIEDARAALAVEKMGLMDQLVDREVELVNIIITKLIGPGHESSLGANKTAVKKALEEAC